MWEEASKKEHIKAEGWTRYTEHTSFAALLVFPLV